ncbi:hypothetical protein GCM10009094_42800 [Massilia aurea]
MSDNAGGFIVLSSGARRTHCADASYGNPGVGAFRLPSRACTYRKSLIRLSKLAALPRPLPRLQPAERRPSR